MNIPRMAIHTTMVGLGLALAASAAAGQAGPPPAPPVAAKPAATTARVTYMRSFENSVPAWLRITVGENGDAVFTEREKKGEPAVSLPFTLEEPVAQAVFAYAATLHDFSGPRLQSHDKVAYTGEKMLAYDSPRAHHAQSYTYTTNGAAATLQNYFERVGSTGMDVVRLRRAVRFQPLDVLGIMDQIQSEWTSHALAAPALLLPELRRVAANAALMQAARRRAAALAQKIQRQTAHRLDADRGHPGKLLS